MSVRNLINDHSYNLKIDQCGRADLNDTEGSFALKGTVSSYDDLPTTGNHDGDTWVVTTEGVKYYWYNDAWNLFAESTAVVTTVDSVMSDSSPHAVQNRVIKSYVDGGDRNTLSTSKTYTDTCITAEDAAIRAAITAGDNSLDTKITNLSSTVSTNQGYTSASISDDTITLSKPSGTATTLDITHPGGGKGIVLNSSTNQYEHTNSCAKINDDYHNIAVQVDELGHITKWMYSTLGYIECERGLSLVNDKAGHSNSVVSAITSPQLLKIQYDEYGHITGSEPYTPIASANRGLNVDANDNIGHANIQLTPAVKGLYKLAIDEYGHIVDYEAAGVVTEVNRGLSIDSDNKIGHDTGSSASAASYALREFKIDGYGHAIASQLVSNSDGSLYINDSSHGYNKIDHKNSVSVPGSEGVYKLKWNSSGHITSFTALSTQTLRFTLSDGSTEEVEFYIP